MRPGPPSSGSPGKRDLRACSPGQAAQTAQTMQGTQGMQSMQGAQGGTRERAAIRGGKRPQGDSNPCFQDENLTSWT